MSAFLILQAALTVLNLNVDHVVFDELFSTNLLALILSSTVI